MPGAKRNTKCTDRAAIRVSRGMSRNHSHEMSFSLEHVFARTICSGRPLPVRLRSGGVGEWLKPAVLKTVRPERVSGGRIPPPPPCSHAFSPAPFLSARKREFEPIMHECPMGRRDTYLS